MMAAIVWADGGAAGGGDGSEGSPYNNLSTALGALDVDGTLMVEGVFLQTINNVKDATWKLTGDLNIDANGNNADTYAVNADASYESSDGGQYVFKISGSVVGRDSYQINGGIQTATSDITMWLADGDRGLFSSAASNPSTVNFPRFKITNHTGNTLYTTGTEEIHVTLGEEGVDYSCQVLDNFRNSLGNTNALSEINIFGGLLIGSDEEDFLATIGASSQPVNINDSITFGAPKDPKNLNRYMVADSGSGLVTFTNSRTYYPPYGTGGSGINLRSDKALGAITEVSPVLGVLPYNNFRRGGMVTLTTDDRKNIDAFLLRNTVCEKYGLVQNLLLDEMEQVTSQEWADLRAAEAQGHLISNHTVRAAQLGDFNGINITSGDPITVDVGANTLTGTALSLTLTDYDDLATLVVAINLVGGYTVSVSETQGLIINQVHTPQSLADGTFTTTILLDSGRVFANEVVAGRTILEANLTNHTDNTFGFVAGVKNDVYEPLFNAANYLIARTTINNSIVNEYSKEKYPIYGALAFRTLEYVPVVLDGTKAAYTLTDDQIYQKVLGTCAWADFYGAVVDIYTHGTGEYPIEQYDIICQAISDSGIKQGTAAEAGAFIREGAESFEGGRYYYSTDYSASDPLWIPAFISAGGPTLTTPYSNRINLDTDVVSAIDFSEGWVGASSFVITELPTGLNATGASVEGTIIPPTGTFITNVEATGSGGVTNAQFQWTTLTIGDPTSGINVPINKTI